MKKEILLKLIKNYQDEISKFMKRFGSEYERVDLLRAWHEGVIEKEGSLSNGIEYELHGIGYRIYYSNIEVDFDFGPNNRFDGFDLWRLKEYLMFRKDIQENFSPDDLKNFFNELVNDGVIAKIYKNSNLYFFVNKGSTFYGC